jgi:hypothetical protein
MLSIAPLFLAAMLFTPPMPFEPLAESAVLDAPTRHIRANDRSMRHLMRRGYRGSRTFADLVARLQRSDVIVYIEQVPRLPGALEGRLMMLPRVNGFRYVRIQLAPRGAPEDAVSILGHELQHAVEVAEAPEVSDGTGLADFYKRTGMRNGRDVYETAAAQSVARRVRRELSLT